MWKVKIQATKRNSPCRYQFRLYRLGLRAEDVNTFSGAVKTMYQLKKVQRFADKKRLKFVIDNEYGVRSSDYRWVFFSNNPPHVGQRYFCAYCGSLLPKNKITIDHLYPVGQASKSVRLQRKLQRMGIDSINAPKNLVAACRSCNVKKGKQMGKWIWRGKIGRHPRLWIIRWILRMLMMTSIIVFVLWWLFATL